MCACVKLVSVKHETAGLATRVHGWCSRHIQSVVGWCVWYNTLWYHTSLHAIPNILLPLQQHHLVFNKAKHILPSIAFCTIMSSEKQNNSETESKSNVWVQLAFRTRNESTADIEVSLEDESPFEIEGFYGNVNKLREKIREKCLDKLETIGARRLTIYRNVEFPKDKKRTFRLSASNAEELEPDKIVTTIKTSANKKNDKPGPLLCVAPFLPNVSQIFCSYCGSVVFGIVLLLTTLHLLL